MSETMQEKWNIGKFDKDYLPSFEEKLFFEGAKRHRKIINFTVLLALATVIATCGVIANSTASVIGAMIIAPLMTPIMGAAAAVSMGRTLRLRQSLGLVAAGILGVIVLSALLAATMPAHTINLAQNPQITSRIHPNLIDFIVALAAGAAGAFATGRQEIADSLAGVAIAISLVPPLSVVGICLMKGSLAYASGAFLLFFTNFIAILVAGTLVFGLMGLPHASRMEMSVDARKRAFQVITVAAVILIAILGFTTYQQFRTATIEAETAGAVQEWLGSSNYELVSVVVSEPEISISLTGDGPLPPIEPLSQGIERQVHQKVVITIHTIPQKSIQYPSGISALAAGI